MRIRQFAERREAEIEMRHRIGQHGRTCALLVMAPVDPGRGNAHSVGGNVVVEQTLRDVEQLIPGNSRVTDSRQEIFEVSEIRLVGPNLLRSQDLVEFDPKPPVASGKALAVDVREND